MKKLKILKLSPDFRYLQKVALKRKCPLKPSENKKRLAQDEKSKFFIFHTKIAYHTLRNLVGFFFLKDVF